jgi:predicted nucleic acid-binding protein
MPIDTRIMLVWAELAADLEKQGRRTPATDFLIAANALHGNQSLATRNEDDFAGSGGAVINPWER